MKSFIRKYIIILRYYYMIIFNKLNKNSKRVITFHEIDNINLFEEKIKFLVKSYNILTPEQINNNSIYNGILITFDDGYKEWAEGVYDILVKYNLPALFFINSGILNLAKDSKKKYIEENLRRTKELVLLDKNGVIKIAKNKLFTIGGHTINHIDIGNSDKEKVLYEIKEDKMRLEEIIGMSVVHFAFPFGRSENITKESINILGQQGYKYLYSIIPSNIYGVNSIFPRDSLNIYDSELLWKAWLSGAYDFKSKEEYKKYEIV